MMQRTLADDLRWAVFVVAGAALGYALLGGGDASALVGSIAGVLIAIVVLNVVRHAKRD